MEKLVFQLKASIDTGIMRKKSMERITHGQNASLTEPTEIIFTESHL